MRLKGSLKHRLIAITLVALLPAIAIVSANAWYEFATEKSRVTQQARVFVRTLLEEQAELITSTKFFLKALSQRPEIQDPQSAQCTLAVREWLSLNPYIINIGIPRADGNLYCNATPMTRSVNVSDRAYFQQAIEKKQFSVGQFQQDRAAGVASINFAYPVFDPQGDVIAAAVAVLSLDWWEKRLGKLSLPESSVALIVDANSTLIASLYGGIAAKKRQELTTNTQALVEEGVAEFIGSDGIERLVVSLPLIVQNTELKARFVVALPTNHVYQSVYNTVTRSVAMLVIGYGSFIALLWWGFATNVLKPVYALLQASKQYIERCDKKRRPNLDQLSIFYRQFTQVIREQQRLNEQVSESERQLSCAYQRLNNLLDNSPFGVVEWDPQLRIQRWSPECSRVFGLSLDEVEERQIRQLPIKVKRHFWSVESFLNLYQQGKSSTKTSEVNYKDDNGCEKVLRWRFSAIYDQSDQLTGILGLFENVTQQVEYQRELEYHAKYDSLTGLPNRYSVQQYISERLHKGFHFSVVLFDIKGFKLVNDHYGHEFGDMLLVELAERINNQLRRGECFSRWGGNEFIYVIPTTEESRQIERVEALIHLFSEPLSLGSSAYSTQLYCGVSSTTMAIDSANDLIRYADLAIYFAKKNSHNGISIYHPSMAEIGGARFELEAELRAALTNDQFELYFQPIKNNRSGRYESAEALIRWNHPTRGMVSPGEFIPVAEESGLIQAIGDWVLESAIRQMTEWRDRGLILNDIAVNLSALQLNDANFVSHLKQLLAKYKFLPSLLTLEVTETSLLSSYTDVVSKIKELKELGIKIALDDFGTGYSSLSYLNELPLSKLKIDRSFVAKIGVKEKEVLLDAIISIAHGLKLNVIAEGIENAHQYDYIVARKCEFSQGFLFSPPVDVSEFERMMQQEIRLTLL